MVIVIFLAPIGLSLVLLHVQFIVFINQGTFTCAVYCVHKSKYDSNVDRSKSDF